MGKFLNNINKESFLATLYTLDTIAPQLQDPDIIQVEDLLQQLIEHISNNNVHNSKELEKDKASKAIILAIEKILSNRFGYTIKFILNSTMDVSTNTISNLNVNVLATNTKRIYNTLKKYLANGNVKFNKNLDIHTKKYTEEEVYTREVNITTGDVLHIWKSNVEEIEKVFKKDGIVIDYKTGKINGLNNKIICTINMDFVGFYREFNFTGKHFMAILLHEIGHNFNALAYSIRTHKSTIVLTDTVLEEIEKKNNSPKGAIRVAYKKITGEDIPSKLLNAREDVVFIEAMDTIYRYQAIDSASELAYRDNEMLADQFASRFGYNLQLAEALVRLDKKKRQYSTELQALSFLYLVSWVCLIVVAMPSLVAIFFSLIALFHLLTFTALVTGRREELFNTVYDPADRRISRIRNDIVRRIRLYPENKSKLEQELKAYDDITEILVDVEVSNPTLYRKIIEFFSSDKRKQSKITYLENLIEDTMENPLYISSARFKVK